MKNRKGYVVLQISVFLGLLAFIGLMLFEIEIDKKKFVDASTNKNEEISETKENIKNVAKGFKSEIIDSNITEEELKLRYTFSGYQENNIVIQYDKNKDLFVAGKIKDLQKLCIVYYDYEVKMFGNSGIIKVIEFYEV